MSSKGKRYRLHCVDGSIGGLEGLGTFPSEQKAWDRLDAWHRQLGLAPEDVARHKRRIQVVPFEKARVPRRERIAVHEADMPCRAR